MKLFVLLNIKVDDLRQCATFSFSFFFFFFFFIQWKSILTKNSLVPKFLFYIPQKKERQTGLNLVLAVLGLS